jgi:uncharacterized protein YycO
MQKSHKFVSRKDGRVIYLSEEGKRNLERTNRATDFKHVGMVTAEERAKEVAEAGKPKQSYSEAKKENDVLVGKVKANVKELSQEELAELEEKTTTIEDELEKDKAKLKSKKKKDEQEEA